jgi:hypothetical protein
MGRLVRSLATLAALGAAGAACWFFLLRDDSEPVTVEEAVASFRSGEAGAVGRTEIGPEPGVYVYATEGYEEVDAFLGSRHEYPDETTVTVRRGGCGLELRWDALAGRSTTWELCFEDGWTIRSYEEVHSFFGQAERTSYRCAADSAWQPGGEEAGTTWRRSCTSGETDERSTGEVVGRERLIVGGESADTLHVLLDLALSGRTRGMGRIEAWLLTDAGLPARLVIENDNRSNSLIGDVRYREEVDLRLTSLEPRR